jgi:hypothetical protein
LFLRSLKKRYKRDIEKKEDNDEKEKKKKLDKDNDIVNEIMRRK